MWYICGIINTKFTNYRNNIYKFVELKLNQRCNYGFQSMEDCNFEGKDYFILYFVLPECWSLAQQRIDDVIENGNVIICTTNKRLSI